MNSNDLTNIQPGDYPVTVLSERLRQSVTVRFASGYVAVLRVLYNPEQTIVDEQRRNVVWGNDRHGVVLWSHSQQLPTQGTFHVSVDPRYAG